jgi:hypothetical protein
MHGVGAYIHAVVAVRSRLVTSKSPRIRASRRGIVAASTALAVVTMARAWLRRISRPRRCRLVVGW